MSQTPTAVQGTTAPGLEPVRKAFEAKIQDKKLLKIDIYSPWEEREEVKWRNNHWEVKTYRYVGANCLAKLKSGKFMVYRMNFLIVAPTS